MLGHGVDGAAEALRRGDLIVAYDAACDALERNGDDLEARYVAALALLRSGAEERAERMVAELHTALARHEDIPASLCEDIEALGARLAKDRALACAGDLQATRLVDAAERYELIARRYTRYYACVNAATLWRLAGNPQRAIPLARRAEDLVALSGDESYWGWATRAEAALVLGNVDDAASSLAKALDAGRDDIAARATTHRQLALLCDAIGVGRDLLDLLRLPVVLHYCGNMRAAPSLDPSTWERRVEESVANFLDGTQIAAAYGALAAGADILIAEELLERDIELQVVLPFSIAEFERSSVAVEGDEWIPRFRRCLSRASNCSIASDSANFDDETLFAFASRIAMGRARNRAHHLRIDSLQLAISDRAPWSSMAGTASDVAVWQQSGGVSVVLEEAAAAASGRATDELRNAVTSRLPFHAIVFADFRGFSQLCDQDYATFVTGVLGPMASAIDAFDDDVLYRNTWGDGLQIVLADVASASRCALAIRDAVASVDLDALALPRGLGLRIATHVGRLVELHDPIRDVMSFWGREITRAARIEPRTPEGEVYASEPFAALLALESDSHCACEYVGRVTTAKDFETIPMYRLRLR